MSDPSGHRRLPFSLSPPPPGTCLRLYRPTVSAFPQFSFSCSPIFVEFTAGQMRCFGKCTTTRTIACVVDMSLVVLTSACILKPEERGRQQGVSFSGKPPGLTWRLCREVSLIPNYIRIKLRRMLQQQHTILPSKYEYYSGCGCHCSPRDNRGSMSASRVIENYFLIGRSM